MKLLIPLLGLTLLAPAWAHKVVGVTDGDTLTLLVDNAPVIVRLANIDAPEKTQAFSEQAKQSLAAMCMGKDAQFKKQDVDVYGRVVASVSCDGVDTGRIQVERGLAWVYTRYNKDLSLPGLEAIAKRDRRGLWSHANAVPPWEHRKPRIKKAVASKQSVEGICFVGRHGEYRIVEGVKRYGC
ncbi:MAG TPA: thermonuclease family protein [Noviherbaspirillum sp.]|jgi:micrococcal nuclease|uniref:thermonuclease family protein n=1 Tax=Noviherbaspirillum sp. TaxID=1926288 RepID=UPI002F93535F